MTDVLEAKAPSGTYTTQRLWTDTETPKQVVDAKERDELKFSARNVLASEAGVLRFVSGATQYSTPPSGVEASLVASPQDQADAIFEAPGAGLSARLSSALAQAEQRFKCFRSRLVATLLDEPIEDGVTHPAEHLIDEALRTASSDCLDWLSRVLVEHYPTRPSISASIVRCIGRLEYDQIGAWGMRVADDALKHKDVEVREAAIRALEAWGGREALDMLRKHNDERPWLNEYVQQVIVDLSGTAS